MPPVRSPSRRASFTTFGLPGFQPSGSANVGGTNMSGAAPRLEPRKGSKAAGGPSAPLLHFLQNLFRGPNFRERRIQLHGHLQVLLASLLISHFEISHSDVTLTAGIGLYVSGSFQMRQRDTV
jgi:hypothetical protein